MQVSDLRAPLQDVVHTRSDFSRYYCAALSDIIERVKGRSTTTMMDSFCLPASLIVALHSCVVTDVSKHPGHDAIV